MSGTGVGSEESGVRGKIGVRSWELGVRGKTGGRGQESGVRIFDGRERRMHAVGWGKAGAAERFIVTGISLRFLNICGLHSGRADIAPSVISGKVRVWSRNRAGGKGDWRRKSLWGRELKNFGKCGFL